MSPLHHKLNLNYGAIVSVKGTQTEIDGVEVRVIGVTSRGVVDNYIVEFADGKTRTSYEEFGQEPIECRALSLPEFCLKLLE